MNYFWSSPVQTDDRQKVTYMRYEPTVQLAQVGSINGYKYKFYVLLYLITYYSQSSVNFCIQSQWHCSERGEY